MVRILAIYSTVRRRRNFCAWRFKAFSTTLQPNRDVKATFGRGVSGEGMDTMVYGAGVVGPKIVDWDDPRILRDIGASADAQKYPLEITSIKATEFTVRYQGESKTRPIVVKPTSSSK
mgnify:CR=1 FL=1